MCCSPCVPFCTRVACRGPCKPDTESQGATDSDVPSHRGWLTERGLARSSPALVIWHLLGFSPLLLFCAAHGSCLQRLHNNIILSCVLCPFAAGKSELTVLAEKFKEQFCREADIARDVNLNSVADNLQVSRRRLYDIVNVLEALQASTVLAAAAAI